MFSIISSANSDSFTSSFPIWITFISFPCQINMARTSKTMLNKSGEGRHSCLVPILKQKVFISLLRMMLAEGFSQVFFIQPFVRWAFGKIFAKDIAARNKNSSIERPKDETEAIADIFKRMDEIQERLEHERRQRKKLAEKLNNQ